MVTSLVTALMIALAGAPSAKDAAKAKADYEKATRYFEAEEYEAAFPFFKSAYALSGHRASTVLALAQCERFLKRYDDALEHYREYLASKPRPKDSDAVLETMKLVEDLRRDAKAFAERDAAAAAAKASRQGNTQPSANTANTAQSANTAQRGSGAQPANTSQPADTAQPANTAQRGSGAQSANTAQPANPDAASTKTVRTDPAPSAAKPALVVTSNKEPPPDDGSVLSSPFLWIGVGVAAIGGAVALGFALSSTSKPSYYGGSTGIIAMP